MYWNYYQYVLELLPAANDISVTDVAKTQILEQLENAD
jgi:hypothetical protein